MSIISSHLILPYQWNDKVIEDLNCDITAYFPLRDLCNFANTSKLMYEICENERIWKKIASHEGIDVLNQESSKKAVKHVYHTSLMELFHLIIKKKSIHIKPGKLSAYKASRKAALTELKLYQPPSCFNCFTQALEPLIDNQTQEPLTDNQKLGFYLKFVQKMSPCIRSLYFKQRELSTSPKYLKLLMNLKTLKLKNRQVSDLSPYVENSSLQKLIVTYSHTLEKLPSWFSSKSIKQLDLSFNTITDITSLSVLTSLVHLKMTNNQITSIPEKFTQLEKLEVLNLDFNQISRFPRFILHLPALSQLSLQVNNIKNLEDDLGGISTKISNKLELSYVIVNLKNNLISSVPATLLKAHAIFNLDNNQLSNEDLKLIEVRAKHLKKKDLNKIGFRAAGLVPMRNNDHHSIETKPIKVNNFVNANNSVK